MPLIKKPGKKTRNRNVHELLAHFKATRTIGTSRPKSTAKAQKQAVAIAYDTGRRAKK